MTLKAKIPKLLLISDNASTLNRLKSVYQSDEVEISNIAFNHDAIVLIEQNKPDIIIMEVMVDEEICLTICKAHSAKEPDPITPIILVAHNLTQLNRNSFYELGVTDIIGYSEDSSELLVKLKYHLRFLQLTQQFEHFNQYLEQKLKQRTQEMELAYKNMKLKNDELIKLTIELEGQKEQYEQVIQGANIGTFDVNLALKNITRNSIASYLIGYTPQEANNLDYFWEGLIHPDDVKKTKFIKHQIEDGTLTNFKHEFRVKHKNNYWVWLSIKGKVTQKDADGNPIRISGIYNDITQRKEADIALERSELALKKVVQSTNNKFGQDFFNSIAISLNQISKADYSFIGRLLPGNKVQTIALCHKGKLIENFIYELKGTPCEDVISKSTCVFNDSVTRLYPDDELLIQMGIEAYVGTPIFGYQKRPLGIIVSLYSEPIHDASFITSIFEIFEAHVGSEIERTETEKALKENQLLLLKAQSIGKIGHWIIDYKNNTLKWSDEVYNIFEIDQSEFIPRDFLHQFTSETEANIVKQKFNDALKTKTEYDHSLPIKLKSGQIKYIHERSDFEYDQDGNPIFAIGTTQDITEYTTNKIELIKHKEHLEELVAERTIMLDKANKELALNYKELTLTNQTINEQNTRLESALKALKEAQTNLIQFEKMASLGILVAGVAHEINNPVNFISSGIEGVKINSGILFKIAQNYHQQCLQINPSAVKEEDLEFLKKVNAMLEKSISGIEIGVERTTSIVKGLRSFSRTDENKATFFNLHENLDNTLIILFNQYKNRIKIHKIFGQLPNIHGYAGLINQLFMNVISNAVQAIENEGNITITTQYLESEQNVKISISDDGQGIDPQIIDKIFDPFFTTKEVGKGTGLGLSIAYNIVKDHNGSIEVKSIRGKGTEFIIKLPV